MGSHPKGETLEKTRLANMLILGFWLQNYETYSCVVKVYDALLWWPENTNTRLDMSSRVQGPDCVTTLSLALFHSASNSSGERTNVSEPVDLLCPGHQVRSGSRPQGSASLMELGR